MDIRKLQSEALSLRLLRRLHPDVDSAQLYAAAARVASTARQAVQFVGGLENIRIELAPLLRYYEWLHWLKVLLYLFDLQFPRSTAVLQHGLSVRRQKRQGYRWPLEAITVHRDGVLQECVRILQPEESFENRLIVGDLLGSLPGMTSVLREFYKPFQHAYELKASESPDWRLVDREIAANHSLTVDEWLTGYQAGPVIPPSTPRPEADPPGLLYVPAPRREHPLRREFLRRTFLLDKPRHRDWLAHYAILYSLSALCRYNPVEWSDIVLWQNEVDALLVREYLALPEMRIEIVEDLLTEGPAKAVVFGYRDAPA
ncbi:MAG: YaaC family protein [Alicyclobacillus herbarius]|uniref:YaaC family protein n=1 Tax=Alicyclobacillus herbarius TaxID=122960 RepID=UPI00235692A6|nr:YaaC family protein [Alicyclobacillus herbarius]MCL6634057.1 YaaC family protein [Alicyclobacillus herbarius]